MGQQHPLHLPPLNARTENSLSRILNFNDCFACRTDKYPRLTQYGLPHIHVDIFSDVEGLSDKHASPSSPTRRNSVFIRKSRLRSARNHQSISSSIRNLSTLPWAKDFDDIHLWPSGFVLSHFERSTTISSRFIELNTNLSQVLHKPCSHISEKDRTSRPRGPPFRLRLEMADLEDGVSGKLLMWRSRPSVRIWTVGGTLGTHLVHTIIVQWWTNLSVMLTSCSGLQRMFFSLQRYGSIPSALWPADGRIRRRLLVAGRYVGRTRLGGGVPISTSVASLVRKQRNLAMS